jgi:cytochrome c peroxidase
MIRRTLGALLALLAASAAPARADVPGNTFGNLIPPPLSIIPVPEPAGLDQIVADRRAAIALGKALFWDMQAGGDGQQACATCHFRAGADNRIVNTLNPGPNKSWDTEGVNARLTALDYPFHKLLDPDDRFSPLLSDSDDVTGSQGVIKRVFLGLGRRAVDLGETLPDPIFFFKNRNVRQVTGRNAPTVINAVFNYRNFWDGRANHYFNGRNPFGARDPNAFIWVDDGAGLAQEKMLLENSALASQAVGPPNNPVEMSWDGRAFVDLGRKLLNLRPLGQQVVAPTDSVLGPLALRTGRGLSVSYADLIQKAFQPRFWASAQNTPDGLSQMVANFSMFWGLAVQMYEATLVSDDSPYDRFAAGDLNALTPLQQRGLAIFVDTSSTGGRCVNCHTGAEFTGATVSNFDPRNINPDTNAPEEAPLERMLMGDGGIALYDSGFYNIGVRLTADDLGVGGLDPFGNPLSLTRQAINPPMIDPTAVDPCTFKFNACIPIDPAERIAVDGAFKTPTPRNVELTGPYFHNGSAATLLQVVEFYTRGGNFHEENMDLVDRDVDGIPGLVQNMPDKLALVAFLKSLTDDRVRYERAPFDHPELRVPNGPHLHPVGARGNRFPAGSFLGIKQ